MSISERQSEAKLPVRLASPSENILLAAIAIGFLVLHILTAALLLPAAAGTSVTAPEETLAQPFD